MNPEIIIIGCANVDILACPASKKVFDEGHYNCDTISMSVGGDALNEATILSRLGKKVELICTLGKDEAGNYLMNKALQCGIQIDSCCQKEKLMTSTNIVLVDDKGNRNFLINKNSSLRKLTRDDVPPLNPNAKILSFASIFIFTDFLEEGLSSLFSEAKEKNLIVCADTTRCKNQETVEDLKKTLPLMEYIFPNENEAFMFTHGNTVEECASILKEAGVKNVIIKCGEKGCYVLNDEISKWYPVKEKVHCIDTTGAGDSFVAGFIKCLSEDKTLDECIEFANFCGSKNVQMVGATEWSKEFCK